MVDRRIVGMLFALLMIPSLSSGAPSPRAEIENFFARAKTILEEATDVDQARQEFRGLVHALFDGRTAARQALGLEWDRRTPADREEFARTFSDVFERAYVELVQGHLPRSRTPIVRVIGEDASVGRQTVVRTMARSKDGSDVPMDYVMARTGDRWRVYDVVIDGVSLVENYRAQLGRVLRTTPYPELLERVRAAAAGPSAGVVGQADAVVYFAENRAELAPGARRDLERIASKLVADDGTRVLVEGHADGRGDGRANETLAQRRALAIREQLVTSGIDAGRIAIVTHGDRRPVCQEQAERCWALNRRASVRLTP